ncbi:MAG: iron-containing alcohol dehydrogenase, partial [Propionibacterium sp.]|nr:iron-containing alcohol dehydrogenase [Propionibacterium sp.]
MLDFHLDTVVKIGSRAMESLGAFAARRALVVTDEFLSGTPSFERMLGHLGDDVRIFRDVLPDPTVAVITRGVAAYLDARPDVVVAYGGGSVLDTAKAMHKAALDAGFGAAEGIVAIPTTSGSGSEVTSFAVITDESTHTKVPITSRDMVARLAILDPEVVAAMPPSLTADSGMDALTHAVEAYVSRGACDFSDALAEKAIALIFEYLPRC